MRLLRAILSPVTLVNSLMRMSGHDPLLKTQGPRHQLVSKRSTKTCLEDLTLEWGFDAVIWELQKQDNTLRSIDQTLKTPTATQANEWREIADGLASRRAFSQSKEFYIKAVSAYPLDYRTYLGLASTYLKLEEFNLATEILEQSLPHAPAGGGFDWRSHSYRLLGHIQACSENYRNAAQLLSLAVSLSPNSVEANYIMLCTVLITAVTVRS